MTTAHQCPAVYPTTGTVRWYCQLPAGHPGAHDDNGDAWVDAQQAQTEAVEQQAATGRPDPSPDDPHAADIVTALDAALTGTMTDLQHAVAMLGLAQLIGERNAYRRTSIDQAVDLTLSELARCPKCVAPGPTPVGYIVAAPLGPDERLHPGIRITAQLHTLEDALDVQNGRPGWTVYELRQTTSTD